MNKNSIPIYEVFNAEYGKIPPQAIEVEEAVIGAFMLEERAIIENKLYPELFYKEEHRLIAETINELHKDGIKIDLLHVTQKIKDKGLIDKIPPTFITHCTSRVSSAAHIEQHLKVLYEKMIRRNLIQLSSEISTKSYNENNDIDDVLSLLNNNSFDVLEFNGNHIVEFNQALAQLTKQINANKHEINITGIPTGFVKLDQFTGGWQGTDLVTIAGETSQGKTSFALKLAVTAGMNEVPGAFYSTEMSILQLTARIVSAASEINAKRILFHALDNFELQKVTDTIFKLNYLPLYTDNINNSLDAICLSIRRMKLKYDIKYAVVDYIQNMSYEKGLSDEQNIAKIVKTFKNLAKELNITIFTLSQLARNKERPFPTIGRLRGSGQIEETSDIVIMLYRPESYDIVSFPPPFEDEEVFDRAMIIIGKGRNIGTGSFLAKFTASTTCFEDLQNQPTQSNIPY